tara:strand:+ start:5479 stop:6921 length:1443 start_codon:yes stop_codon:yes gene_type:complete
LINHKISLQYIIEYDLPLVEAIVYMDNTKSPRLPIPIFERFVMGQLDIAKKQKKGLDDEKQTLETIRKTYHIRNLVKHNFIFLDEGDDSITLTNFMDLLIRNMSEKMKIKPITDKKFKAHAKILNDIIDDAQSYSGKSESEKEIFLEYLNEFLREVKQDFETNRLSIQTQTDNLSKLLNDTHEHAGTERIVMKEIINLCEKYVEPFFSFIRMSRNTDGFLPSMAKLRDFFGDIGLYVEEAEVSKFVLNFSSYVKDIKEVYERINDYRRKGQGDLRVYNAFEKAFNVLEQTVLEMQDGKLVRNNLGSNLSYLSDYPYFKDIIVSNVKPVHTANDFDSFVEQFIQIEKALLIKADVPQLTQDFKADIDLDRLMARKAQKELVRVITQENNRTIHIISNLLSRNISELRKPDSEVDIISKVDRLLRSNLKNYRPFFTLYAYIFLRKNVKSVHVGYNQRLTLKDIDGKESFTYRPVYIKGHNHD